MAPSLSKLIVARAKRDPEFKRQVLNELYRLLAEAEPKTPLWRNLDKAITAFERMK
jgi:hypothetical protein